MGNVDLLKKMLDVNLIGFINCVQSIIPNLKTGYIVSIGSVDGTFGNPNNSMYSVTKTALHCYSRCLAASLRNTNIKVLCIVPGTINDDSNILEISKFISFFLQGTCNLLNGQVVRLDGGHHLFPL
jgi:short-subunit dehydrogenase